MRPVLTLLLPAALTVAPASAYGQSRVGQVSLDTVLFAPALEVDLAASKQVARGLYARDLIVGSGRWANRGDQVTVRYAGALADGRAFTAPAEPPATFKLGAGTVIAGWDRGLSGMRARVTTPAGRVLIETPLLGRGNLSNVLAAAAVAIDFGIPLDEVADAASQLRPADRRGTVRRLGRGVTIVDDSYNSSPAALAKTLEVIARETGATRKIAVIGEMLELGEHATRLHTESGRTVARSGVDVLFAVGADPARALAAAAIEEGMPAEAVTHFATSEEAATAVASAVRPGDLVLVKGSRGIRTDRVVDALTAEFA